MIFQRRLRYIPALLGVTATLAAVGTQLFGDMRPGTAPPAASSAPAEGKPDGGQLADELAANKFSKTPVLTYQPRDGELLFAWQIQPSVVSPTPRPRDLLVLVDTTASQAGSPLAQARQIVATLPDALRPEDRVSVWTLSTPDATRTLTKDFQPADSLMVKAAATALSEVEYGSGAADLKGGIEKALATMPRNLGRHQVVLYLGDGESAFKPLNEADRLALGNRMDLADQYFFAVPLGLKLDANNLHGLATVTGGAVVRLPRGGIAVPAKRQEFLASLKTALDTPVVKPAEWKFGAEVGESYPTKLPPLRADRSTLVMGKVTRPGAAAVSATVKGTINGRAVELKLNQPLPAPRVDNYFLNLMLAQWRNAPHKDAPAMLQSDRALALASTQVRLYREEFLTQAVWAMSLDRIDDAGRLYDAALKVDPTDKEASSGVELVKQMKAGKLTKADLARRISQKTGAWKVSPDAIRKVVQDPTPAPAPAKPGAGAAQPNPNAAQDLLREAAARRAIEEQRYRVLVDTTIRRARQLLRADPDAAYQDLKRQRDDILGYDAIGEDARRQMVAELEGAMREVFIKGAEVKRQADAERQAVARTRQRLNEFDRLQDEIARDKNRIDQFRQLMQQARFELAYQEAQLMIQEKRVKGLSIPPQALASYIIGQQAVQLREWKELTRIKQDRFLLAMMQAEKSHIPYPDEPPVHFPPAAVWRELTSLRREAYLNSNLGNNPTEAQKQLKSIIEDSEVQLKEGSNINEIPLFELLSELSKKHNITFIIMEEYFKADGVPSIREEKPRLASTQLRGLKLGNFLDIVLASMNATYVVRPEYVEITTFDRRLTEKVTRVFPVADLAIPIPSAVNQQTLYQNLFFQNQTLAIFGQASLFGGGLQNLGGFGGVGGGGFPGGINQQGGGGQQGQAVFGGAAQVLGTQSNQGAGGGFTSFGGGNLGQFGNLGGQFGLQGGDQSQLLMKLIFETVAKGEWANLPNSRPQPGMGEEDVPLIPVNQLNSLGYYPPARALIIRGTSRYHPASSLKLKKQEGNVRAPGNPNGGQVVIGPGGANPPKVAVVPPKPEGLVNPKIDAAAMRKKLGNDPKKVWNEAIARTVTDPGLIVASAEFLMEMEYFSDAAEVLKANLRKGLATDSWAHEALAVALQAAGGNPAEIERAALSGIDLEPDSAKAYLKAAKVEANLKKHDRAFAFCKRASECSPNDPTPYANALAYAEFASDVKSDAVMWAADNLLKRDWSTRDGIDYHREVKERLPKLEAKLRGAGQNAAVLAKAISDEARRDLVIELLWQGNADLDLIIQEPSGSTCSPVHKRTTGGGVLKADVLEQRNDRSEIYTASSAFAGTYTVSAKQAFGRSIGGTATLRVTKFKGTPQEQIDLLEVTPGGKPVEIKLKGGSRTSLADVSEVTETVDFRAEATGAPLTTGTSGLGGGVGTAGRAMSAPTATSGGLPLPIVTRPAEERLPGISSAAADLRATYKLNPDRKTFSVTVNPVFAGKGEIALPKVPLLPGGEGK